MNAELLSRLRVITEEEKQILQGKKEIDRNLYMKNATEEIDSNLLLERGKLITVRPHTRFVHFPAHTHNYIEMVYMCSGKTVHIINGHKVELCEGEILLLNKGANQEIYPAKEEDIAVNFIILPEFFDATLALFKEQDNLIKNFLVDALKKSENEISFLHFKVSGVLPVQNLIENLIWTITNRQSNKRSINQLTMGLLFLQLASHTQMLNVQSDTLAFKVMRYVEENYKNGSLELLSELLSYNMCHLSREIKKETGKTFTELMQKKRLSQAAFLLKTTSMKVIDVAQSVGYDNISFFHRIFKAQYNLSPHKYRKAK